LEENIQPICYEIKGFQPPPRYAESTEKRGRAMPPAITIVSLGKKNDVLDEEVARYRRLIGPYASLSVVLVKPPGFSEMRHEDALVKEGKLLQSKWPEPSFPVALSEEGRSMTSVVFSRWLSSLLQSQRHIVFTIGGAFGLSPLIKGQCRDVLSLSAMTLPHKLCALVLVEQLYRAFTILHHHPYHK
jgi:23S rRNA (pseudouridine1915-N3)-methyltransferase